MLMDLPAYEIRPPSVLLLLWAYGYVCVRTAGCEVIVQHKQCPPPAASHSSTQAGRRFFCLQCHLRDRLGWSADDSIDVRGWDGGVGDGVGVHCCEVGDGGVHDGGGVVRWPHALCPTQVRSGECWPYILVGVGGGKAGRELMVGVFMKGGGGGRGGVSC